MSGTREEAYAHWSRLHGGMDPTSSPWVSGWVRLVHRLARPLSRRGVTPDAVTAAGVALTGSALLVTALGGPWPLVATVILVAGAVLDGVDGAVAAQTGSASRWGRVLDALADRVSDMLLLLMLVVLGAPAWLGMALVVLTLLHESVRASAQAAGLRGAGAVTVWERPSRVIVAGFGAGLVGLEWLVRRAGADILPAVDARVIVTVLASIALALAVTGLVTLLLAVRRRLGQAGPTSPATMREDSTTSGSPPPGCEEPPTR